MPCCTSATQKKNPPKRGLSQSWIRLESRRVGRLGATYMTRQEPSTRAHLLPAVLGDGVQLARSRLVVISLPARPAAGAEAWKRRTPSSFERLLPRIGNRDAARALNPTSVVEARRQAIHLSRSLCLAAQERRRKHPGPPMRLRPDRAFDQPEPDTAGCRVRGRPPLSTATRRRSHF
jgi:hypothetical protein